jgi:putative membrane protein
LAALMAFSVIAVVGYAVFGRDPSRVAQLSPAVARFYGVSFVFFAQAQIVLAGLVLAIHLFRKARWSWLAAFGVVYGISLGSELLGTAYGVPFGPYAYTDLLGAKWLGLVPVLIPLSWFFMAIPAYGLAERALKWSGEHRSAGERRGSRRRGWPARVLLGSLLLLAWDLSLDPAMSEVTRYWVWGERGPYYGMPLVNLVGWYVTGLALMAALEWLGARRWLGGVSTGWLMVFYAANLVLPLGMALAAGLWGAAVATAMVLGGVVVWASLRSRSPDDLDEPALAAGGASSGAEVVR